MNGKALGYFGAGLVAYALFASVALAGHYTWTTSGPVAGAIHQINVDPSNPDTILAVAGGFGPHYLFRTTDGGQNWSYVEGLLGARLIRDPESPPTLYSANGGGVFKSEDGGASWQLASVGLPTSTIFVLALAPSAPSTLYVFVGANPAQLFVTNDGAVTWSSVAETLPANYWYDLTVDPQTPLVLYAFTEQGLLKSGNGGSSWSPSGSGLPTSSSQVVIDAAAPTSLYALTSDSGIFKSTDAGASWSPANDGIQTQNIVDLAFDPTNPSKLYAASRESVNPSGPGGLFGSTNGGGSWSQISVGLPGVDFASAVAVDPVDSSKLYAGDGPSVLHGHFLQSSDSGSTWTVTDSGLSGFFSTGIAAHPTQPGNAYAASFIDTFSTTSAGSDWNQLGTVAFPISSVTVDQSSGSTLYGPYGGNGAGGVYKSTDDGQTWVDSSSGLPPAHGRRIDVARTNSTVLLLSTDDGIYQSSDGGGSWSNLLTGLGEAVAIDPMNDQILYASRDYQQGQPSFLRSQDGGVTWSQPAGTDALAYPFDIAVDPSDPNVVYIAYSSHIFRSVDRGLTFSESDSGLPTGPSAAYQRLGIDPSNSQTLYVADAFAQTVYRTVNGAQSWSPLPALLPAFSVAGFAIDVTGKTLYASSFSGIFTFDRSFLDVPDTDPFWTPIDAAAMNGVSVGCGQGNFCPATPLNRAQVAVFLLRGQNGPAFKPPPATGGVFGDVPASAFAAAWIEALALEGVTSGCGGGNYCPSSPLTRAELAVMLLKAKHGSSYQPPPATGMIFSDVPVGAFAAAWIEELAAEGISAGCGGGMYCPDEAATRAQAATFVVRAFSLS